ncbi:Rieske-like 2Fe-2S protein [Pseudoduganella lurida]|uniref:Rieske-like 2Fe-2S protein n=1 Tax=Pseudoduganella lurida TaxID=1036180 RepID=A0A562R0I9_9BURK|nr:Rieske 2Fe-2S domain-containing protein [Pseudoduganella lurida]TWI62571.1 Rieske-like 2Fe-2S protein [Pseudoduganella lurida]
MTNVISTSVTATASQGGAWYPVIPASDLVHASSIALGFVEGEELALWRAPNGVVQAWENRCPHRGMRFTLGRVVNGRLSCAYHGWEFQSGSGRCSAIPAHPEMPVPRSICARTFQAAEANGIVWVARQQNTVAPPVTAVHTILRSLGIRAPADHVIRALAGDGWRSSATDVFLGDIGGQQVVLYLARAAVGLVMLHVGLVDMLDPAQTSRLHAGLRQLRTAIETQWRLASVGQEGERQ